ncbi:hypothetical protein NDU88_004774 [Pleurodeles waltl]|uniref:Uncharacterized protein n=1 Tax=Pleurodeles waltl TaxID=8319 RepID=A0AAV7LKU3_PLEWA|nr:hypothetical protein NDU88_004774 [Pleurodeles waltl]
MGRCQARPQAEDGGPWAREPKRADVERVGKREQRMRDGGGPEHWMSLLLLVLLVSMVRACIPEGPEEAQLWPEFGRWYYREHQFKCRR